MLHSIPLGILSFPSGSFSITNSAVFNDDDTDFLTTTPSSAGNTKTWTVAFWWKIGKITTGSVKDTLFAARSSNPYLFLQTSDGSPFGRLFFGQFNGSSYDFELYTDMALRDPHAWYHIVVAVDTTQAIDNNRVKIYVNGSQVTFGTANYPSQNLETYWNTTYAQNIGHDFGSRPMDGYLSQWVNVDGSQLSSTNFGETDDNGVWRPIEIKAENLLNYSTTNAALGGTYTSTSGTAANAWDENTSTSVGEGASTNVYAQVYKSSGITATRLRFYNEKPAGYGARIENFILYASNSSSFGGEEVTLASGVAPNATGYHEVTFTNTTSYTYYRLFVTDSYDTTNVAINFFDVRLFEASNGVGTNGFFLPFTNSVELGLGGAPSSSTAATVTFVAATTNSATSTNYTFSSQSLSTAATGRIIAVVVASERSSSGARTVSSLTVAGTSAALVVRQTSDNGDCFEIWEAAVASGTSGDIVVNHSGSMDSCGIGVYAVYNARYQQHFTIKAEGTSLSGTLVIPENSIAIGGGHSTSTGATGTFVGLTENYDETIDSHISHAGASTSTASSAGGGTTISYTSSSPHADDTLMAATWFPSDGPNNLQMG